MSARRATPGTAARVRAEEALQASEHRYRSLVDLSPDAIVVNAGGKYVFANPAAARLFGASSPQELLGEDALERIHPDHRKLATQRIDQAFGGIPSVPREIEILRLDGTPVQVEAAGAGIDFEGRPAIQVVFRDITERNKADELLRLTQLSVDRAADLIHWIGPDGRILYASDSTCQRHGYSREEMLRLTIFDLDPLQTPESWAEHWRELKEKTFLTFESVHQTRGGEVFPIEVTANYVECGGREYNFSFGRDVAERKRLEESLRRTQFVVDHSQDLVHWLDSEGRLLYVNDACCRRLGYSREELLGMTINDIDPEAPRPWQSHFSTVGERGSLTFESSHKTRDGEVFPVEITVNYLSYGGQEYNCASARDITERKQAENALRRSEERFSRVFHGTPVALALSTVADGRFVDVNDSFLRSLGYERDEVIGRTVSELSIWAEPEQSGRLRGLLREKGSVSGFEHTFRSKCGQIGHGMLSAVALDIGSEPCLLTARLDITDRKLWEEELTAQKEHLSLLLAAAVEMSHCLTFADVERAGIRLACQATNCDGGLMSMLPSTGHGRIVRSRGLTHKGRAQLTKVLLSSPAVERATSEQISILLEEAETATSGTSNENVFASVLVVPIMSRGRATGVLCLGAGPDHPGPNEADSALAEGVAAMVGVAWENARLYEDARYLAERDPVTGLLNHRGIHTQLERELARSERSGGHFAVVMMDLDNFKLLNDTWGHAVGDRVLKDVSSLLVDAVRRGDIVGRYGGDEFVALLPDTEISEAVGIVERIQQALGEFGFKVAADSTVPVFISCGVAAYPHGGRRTSELLAVADANLYRSKREGGNRVTASDIEETLAGAPPEPTP